DDAFFHREPGVGLGQHVVGATVTLVLGLAAIYVFPLARPGLRSATALLVGALAIVNGMLHVKHIADSGAAASDVTGVLAAAAGAVLVGLAIAIPWVHRGEGAASRRRRWTYRVLAGPVRLVAFFYTVVPMGIGGLGLSTGADVLVQVAGQRNDLKAVVADGTAAGSFADTQRVMGITAITPFMLAEFTTVRLTSGSEPGPVIEDMVKQVSEPLLLVAAGP